MSALFARSLIKRLPLSSNLSKEEKEEKEGKKPKKIIRKEPSVEKEDSRGLRPSGEEVITNGITSETTNLPNGIWKSDSHPQPTKGNKRRTVQVEYVTPRSQIQRGEPAAVGASSGSSRPLARAGSTSPELRSDPPQLRPSTGRLRGSPLSRKHLSESLLTAQSLREWPLSEEHLSKSSLTAQQSECLDSIVTFHDDPTILLPYFMSQQHVADVENNSRSAYTPLKPWQTRILVLHAETATFNEPSYGDPNAAALKSGKRGVALRGTNGIFRRLMATQPHSDIPSGGLSPLNMKKNEIVTNIKTISFPDSSAVWYEGDNERGQHGYFSASDVMLEERQPSRITCQLLPVDVIDGPGLGFGDTGTAITYEALSYAWGDPTPTCLITVNGKDFLIARELATALLYLRDTIGGKDRYLWCDGICINQLDLQEKADQVKNMLRIFEKAEKVVAWLGTPTVDSGRVFYACGVMEKPDIVLEDEIGPLLHTAVDKELKRTWFRRTWVRQEVFAAKNMTVQIGHHQHDFNSFASWVERLDTAHSARLGLEHRDRLKPGPKHSMPSTFPVYMSEYQHSGTDRYDFKIQGELQSFTQHWLSVLSSGAFFEVSDERDRVYGALGLLTSPSIRFFTVLPTHLELLSTFPIDYTKSVSEVYQDVTRYLIQMTGCLEVLDVFSDRTYLENSDFPSWATDWSRQKEEFTINDSNIPKLRNFQYQWRSWVPSSPSPGQLKLRGVRISSRILSIHAEYDIPLTRGQSPRSTTLKDFLDTYCIGGKGYDDKDAKNTTGCKLTYVLLSVIMKEGGKSELACIPTNLSDMPMNIASYLAGPNYVAAKIDGRYNIAWDYGSTFHSLVPRNVSLDDIVVAFYGSVHSYLLRPVTNRPGQYRYLGPVVGLQIKESWATKAASDRLIGPLRIRIPESHGPEGEDEEFILV